MAWKALVCGFGLLALVACGAETAGEFELETDSPAPQQDLYPWRPSMPPATTPDAGSQELDPIVVPAADGGSFAPVVPNQPAPAQPMVPDPPPAPPPLTLSFSPPGGGFTDSLALRLETADPTAQVHYTLDGSLPTLSSPIATTTLPIVKSSLVRAVATRDGQLGPVTSQAYFRIDADAREFRSDLPIIVVDMQNAPLPDPTSTEHVSAVLGVFEPTAGITQLGVSASLTSRAGIKVRGRSTRTQPKHTCCPISNRSVRREDSARKTRR